MAPETVDTWALLAATISSLITGIERELISRPLLVGGAGSTAASAAAFALQAFGAGEALEGAPAETLAAAAADLEAIYAAHETPDGVAVAGAWWLVSARLG